MSKAETSQFPQSKAKSLPTGFRGKPSNPSELEETHLLIVEDDEGRRVISLGEEVYSLGRDRKSDIRLFSMFVSRQHATLLRQEEKQGSYQYQIIDGNLQGQLSANGILINGRKLQTHQLKDEDEIIFGAGVSARYYMLNREERKSGPLDPFDITLIDPGMVEESEEGF
ncbi:MULTISPECIES: FHA domain-containing protein [unclassified Coleofasciculus]|uniref:FHA domain-containing protein n=1 Tax=unclassified Coleofasciculus TaxID=2692782 RepID=UPI0018809FE6|nr:MULTISPECIES: FHA domain-containing protein [unclassified Coleofasciculus]MBE9126410.1 FHA domain-containing protein [Coleofasciculus sp. LEGE 07081]MBE9149811.1 FHA domain-containing protein [Coleofasciculus sp. LEGE 07092]